MTLATFTLIHVLISLVGIGSGILVFIVLGVFSVKKFRMQAS